MINTELESAQAYAHSLRCKHYGHFTRESESDRGTRVISFSVPLIILFVACALRSIAIIENTLITGRRNMPAMLQVCAVQSPQFENKPVTVIQQETCA